VALAAGQPARAGTIAGPHKLNGNSGAENSKNVKGTIFGEYRNYSSAKVKPGNCGKLCRSVEGNDSSGNHATLDLRQR
jgi:hypothetical protein